VESVVGVTPTVSDHLAIIRAAREALSCVDAGACVGVGGALNAGHPTALVRALMQAAPGDLTLVAGFGGLDVDLAVAHGGVRRLIAAFVGAEGAAPLPPGVRWAVEEGYVEAWDIDEGVLLAALRAAAQRLPFSVWTAGIGTAAADNPLVERDTDPLSGKPYLKIRPLEIDVALLWAEGADEDGNVLRWGPDFGDEAFANAADLRIVQVERVLSTDVLARTPDRVSAWQADIVVSAPLGTYPFASTTLNDDLAWMVAYRELVERTRVDSDWSALHSAVGELLALDGDDDAFLERVGVKRLRELMA
jgi:glutaconate CoA-transferase, subunit A